MNEYTYDQICVGMTEEFKVVVTKEKQNLFREISGDVNPLHEDINFTNKINPNYKDILVFGMLTASFYSQLVGVYLPGKYCLFHSIDTKFLKPVYIGDELTISGTVSEKRDKFKQIVIKSEIRNQHKDKVSKAIIQTGVFDVK